MCDFLAKHVVFEFDDACKEAFNIFKERLTSTRILPHRNWNLPFEIMCNASDIAIVAVLGK